MMSTKAEILEQAMTLPEEERRDLAEELMESFQPSIDEAWGEEITRRVERVLEEGSRGDEWDVVKARVLDRLGLA